VVEGATSGFTIQSGAGCQIADVMVDGVSAGAITAYQFTGVAANHTIAASYLDVAAPQVAVTSPAGGEMWAPGSSHDVTWAATDNLGVDSVSVEVSLAGFAGPWLAVANGLPNSGHYTWTVPVTNCDSARVRIVAYDHALNTGAGTSPGTFTIESGIVGVGDEVAAPLGLEHPTPNPSRDAAGLRFSLPHEGVARLEILDLAGRRVWGAEAVLPAGTHTSTWDGRTGDGGRLGAGLYFVRLTTPWGIRTQRMVRLR
jgi:hypothetical protein